MAQLKLYASIEPGEGKIRFKLSGLTAQYCKRIVYQLYQGINQVEIHDLPMLMYYGSSEYEARFNTTLDLGTTYMVRTTVYDENDNVSSGPLQAAIDIPDFSVTAETNRVEYSMSGMSLPCAKRLDAEIFQVGSPVSTWSDSDSGGIGSYNGWFSALSAGTAYDLFINTYDDDGEVRYEFYASITTKSGPTPYVFTNGAWTPASANVVSGGAFQQTTPNIS